MTEDPFDRLFGGTQEERAAKLDGAAMADPTRSSANEVALGVLLADILGYRPVRPGQHARWLLRKCGDYEGLRRLIVAIREEGRLEWVQLKRKNAYSLRHWLAEEYAKERQAEEQRRAENTTEGRVARYASYPGIQM